MSYQDIRWGGDLTPRHKCSRCIPQPQPTRLWIFDQNHIVVPLFFLMIYQIGDGTSLLRQTNIWSVFFDRPTPISAVYRSPTVTYWPRPSYQKKKCTCVNNRCIRSNISGATLTVEGLNWVRIVTLAGSRWTTNYYKTPATGSSHLLERRCWNESHIPEEAGPPGLRLSSPGERERKAVIARRVGGGGQYVAVFVRSSTPSYTQPFQ